MSAYNPRFEFENEYSEFLRFVDEHRTIPKDMLDGCFVNSFKLFNVPTHEGISRIENQLDKIILTLPAMKRIFAKPIVHLKDVYEVVPTESVRIINNYTVTHAAVHSELWSGTKNGDIKPQKLMTIEKTENYVIYENVMFAKAVDTVLAFVKKAAILLKDILYGCQELNFNLLDNTQHSSYFLAIGKLRKGYSSFDNKNKSSYLS